MGLFLLLGATLLIYWPGLNGPLLLDDIPNLRSLAAVGPVDDKSTFLQFVLRMSHSYPIRPLSFASFLINDNAWPLYTWMHKYTNVMIHLLNGVLVFWLALLLCRPASFPPYATGCIALTTAALWLLAPLQVSTVLYLIQRMTELSATFVLCGLITYCYGRQRLNEKPASAFSLMTVGIVIFGTLGFLCKQNAVLLTLQALVLEYALLRFHFPVQDSKLRLRFSAWKWLILVAPLFLAFGYLFSQDIFAGYDYRPFTAFERIASQPRILFDYVQNLLFPTLHGMGLTHDDYNLSTGLLSPPTTILAILGLLGLVIAALYTSRVSASMFGLAVLWFVAGHVLESSVLALEKYWEHRNYLPAFGPFFAISYGTWSMRHRLALFLRSVLVFYVALLAFLTQQNVTVWSSHLMIGEFWAADHPDSVRAQQIRANYWSRQGYFEKANEIMERAATLRPDSMGAQLQVLLTTCRVNPDDVEQVLARVKARIPVARIDNSVAPTLKYLKPARDKFCPELSNDDLLELIDLVLNNESANEKSSQIAALLTIKASLLSNIASPQAVVSHLYAAFQRHPSQRIGLIAVSYLYSIKEYEIAMQVLTETDQLEPRSWDPDNFRENDLEKWREKIRQKLEEKEKNGS